MKKVAYSKIGSVQGVKRQVWLFHSFNESSKSKSVVLEKKDSRGYTINISMEDFDNLYVKIND